MSKEELIVKIEKIKKIRLLSRIFLIIGLALAYFLYSQKIDLTYICIGFIAFAAIMMFGIGFPTQKKLGTYENELKKLEE